jgi:hypothetical protein
MDCAEPAAPQTLHLFPKVGSARLFDWGGGGTGWTISISLQTKLALIPVLGAWRTQDWKNGIQDRRQVAEWFIFFISLLQAFCHMRKIKIIVSDYGKVMSCSE